MNKVWPIGVMLWRIGEILDLAQQLEWVRQQGFEAVSLHADPGLPGVWCGLDPATTDAMERRRWRERLAPFVRREVHAPIPDEITLANPARAVEALAPAVELACDLGVDIVTVHAQTPAPDAPVSSVEAWRQALVRLDGLAGEAGVIIGLELMGNFSWLERLSLAHTGLTLDVGHMYHHNGAGYRPYGSIGGLVRAVSSYLVHLHVHDVSAEGIDHIEVGTGIIAFDDLLDSLVVGYRGMICLEMNPDRVSPEGILRSRERLLTGCGACS